MADVRLYGAAYSVYVQAGRMALHEKGVAYELVPVDVFADDRVPYAYLTLHPFGRIPALEHVDFRLYETSAITRYIDEAFDGPRLQPVEPRQRARMNQFISIADAYVYPHLVWGLYVELVSRAERGEAADDARVALAWELAPTCLKALTDLIDDDIWLCGDSITLADLHLAPMFALFLQVPGASEMMAGYPRLERWWRAVSEREAFTLSRG